MSRALPGPLSHNGDVACRMGIDLGPMGYFFNKLRITSVNILPSEGAPSNMSMSQDIEVRLRGRLLGHIC